MGLRVTGARRRRWPVEGNASRQRRSDGPNCRRRCLERPRGLLADAGIFGSRGTSAGQAPPGHRARRFPAAGPLSCWVSFYYTPAAGRSGPALKVMWGIPGAKKIRGAKQSAPKKKRISFMLLGTAGALARFPHEQGGIPSASPGTGARGSGRHDGPLSAEVDPRAVGAPPAASINRDAHLG